MTCQIGKETLESEFLEDNDGWVWNSKDAINLKKDDSDTTSRLLVEYVFN